MKPEMIIPIGIPASGKSTYAMEWLAEDPDNRVRVNYDEMRRAQYGPDWIWNRKDEEAVQRQAREIVTKAIRAGLSVIVDNTNLSRHVRASWTVLGNQLGAEVIEQDISATISECISRDQVRGDARVGRAVIEMMAIKYGYLDLPDRPIVIVDIDGTVADGTTRLRHLAGRHAWNCSNKKETIWQDGRCGCGAIEGIKPNWQAYFAECDTDLPIAPVIKILHMLETHTIVFISGRPIQDGRTKVGIITEDWLNRHNIPVDMLLLKHHNTHQPAVEFKQEMLELLPAHRVEYVFDDDERCCKMYREQLGSQAVVLQIRAAAGGMP